MTQPPQKKTPCEMGIHRMTYELLANPDDPKKFEKVGTCAECGERAIVTTNQRPAAERWQKIPVPDAMQSRVVGAAPQKYPGK